MAKICMNEACRATTSFEWKNGWGLKSGGFATLCYNCGSAFENLVYCERFHVEESGWRECRICGKRIHCGCIASKDLHDYLDFGGIGCINCAKSFGAHSIRSIQIPGGEIPNGFGTLTTNNNIGLQSSVLENKFDGSSFDRGKPMLMSKTMAITDSSIGLIKQEGIKLPIGEMNTNFSNLTHQSFGSSMFPKSENNNTTPRQVVNDLYESLAQPSLTFSLGTPLRTPNTGLPFSSVGKERKEKPKVPSFQQGEKTRHILPKLPKSGLGVGPEANNGTGSQTRIARPPAEGRGGRNQLLPRYWPRMTDKELQKISGDLNSTIVPLFEKVLSASDAGRIGRLVLPKACAEAYFPPISQSEGLPLRVQDITGKEWTFQFRFWPNNNSRMYVLEGVTPCIQNMQLQAGDTVIFSRIDPGGKLVMGFRKASSPVDMQDGQASAFTNGALSGETSFSGGDEHLTTPEGKKNEDLLPRPMLNPEKKRTRNIGSKSKRLLMHSEDAMELSLTWKEAQDLLRPNPSDKPTIVMIEDYEFEEYYEPPIFGKKTIFTARPSGEQDQWAQCDSCFKWRKLPCDVLLPPKWMCSDNVWDSNRCSCSAPDEMSPKELDSFLRVGKDPKKRKSIESSNRVAEDHEPSGLDALATAAVLGDSLGGGGDSADPSAAATTRHPRHRPGCTCIVCIQPPSGKFKHKPTCVCNVCMTVKRRFKTLMLRKKRQSEEAEIAREKDQNTSKPESEMEGMSVNALKKAKIVQENDQYTPKDELEMEGISVNVLQNVCMNNPLSGIEMEVGETSNGNLDLNCHPNHEDDLVRLTMESLLHAARKNGRSIFSPSLLSETAGESKSKPFDETIVASLVGQDENKADEG